MKSSLPVQVPGSVVDRANVMTPSTSTLPRIDVQGQSGQVIASNYNEVVVQGGIGVKDLTLSKIPIRIQFTSTSATGSISYLKDDNYRSYT